MSDGASGLAAHELERIRILLLRHHAAAGGRRIGQLEEPEFLARHQDEVFGDSRQVHHRQRHRVQEAGREIAIGRRVHAVGDHAAEAEPVGEELRVDGVAGAGDRAGAERQRVRLLARGFEARVIAAQRRRMTQQEVRHEHRHRAPQVRVRRHQRIAGLLGLIGERRDGRAQSFLEQRNAAAQIQPQVDRDLLVARSAGVQTTAGIADARHQLPLDKPVHVLVVAVDPRRILAALLENRGERLGDRPAVRGLEHAGARQRFGPRQAAGHVVFEKTAIERERHAEVERGRIRRGIKSSRPQRLRHAESFFPRPGHRP